MKNTPLLLTLLILFTSPVAAADIAVIVGKNNANNSMDASTIARIFLGKTSNFPDGGLAIPIDQSMDSDIRAEFGETILGKTSNQLKAYWSRLIFTGRGSPPAVSTSATDIKKLISNNPNLIGYINAGEVDDSIKVIYRF